MTEARRLALRLYQQRWRAKRKAQGAAAKRAPRARQKQRAVLTAPVLRGTDALRRLRLQAQRTIRARHDSLATADPNAFNRRVSAEWHRLLKQAGIHVEGETA